MIHDEFKIESLPDKTFRVGKIRPTELLAITQIIDLTQFQTTEELMNFCFENTEVLMGEKWMPVKTKNRDVYQPMGIENDYTALMEIYKYMMENVIAQVFTKSSESTEKIQ